MKEKEEKYTHKIKTKIKKPYKKVKNKINININNLSKEQTITLILSKIKVII